MKKAIFIFSLLLSACAIPSGGYSKFSTEKICIDYLTLPDYNINQGERAAELSRRGESCRSYVAAAQLMQQQQYLREQANAIATQKAFDDGNRRMFDVLSNQPRSINCTSIDLGGIIDTRCK